MDVLVTGGAGFIGSNLVDALLARGDRVAVLDDLSTGRHENLDPALAAGAELHVEDVRDAEAVAGLVASIAPEVVLHLAAQIDVRRSIADPVNDTRVNVEGTLHVLEAARRAGVQRLVNVSSGGAIYGDTAALPTPDDHTPAPLSPYGASKLAAEGFCDLYARLHGLSTVSLRFANVYGPRQNPLGEGGVIAIFCHRARAGQAPLVFGDGLQTRDFVFVDDAVAACLAAADARVGGTINVGTGIETSVLDLLAALAPHAEGELAPRFEDARAGEVRRSALDASRADAMLGWHPAVALGAGLERTLAWDAAHD